jgi:hypothetical protein
MIRICLINVDLPDSPVPAINTINLVLNMTYKYWRTTTFVNVFVIHGVCVKILSLLAVGSCYSCKQN